MFFVTLSVYAQRVVFGHVCLCVCLCVCVCDQKTCLPVNLRKGHTLIAHPLYMSPEMLARSIVSYAESAIPLIAIDALSPGGFPRIFQNITVKPYI